MPGRNYTLQNYRYAYNGKENDKEFTPGTQNYGMRTYDNRLGRFFSLDPIKKQFPELSPYQFASNSPIWSADLNGLEAWIKTRDWSIEDRLGYAEFVMAEIKKITENAIKGEVSKNTCFDCADLATTLLIRYAANNGLPLSFTNNRDGKTQIRFDSKEFQTPEEFEDAIRRLTGAASIQKYEISKIEGTPMPGDLAPLPGHLNIVIKDDPNNPVGRNRVPIVSGTFPESSGDRLLDPSPAPFGGVPILHTNDRRNRFSNIGLYFGFYRFNVLNNVVPERIEPKQIKIILNEPPEPELRE